MISLRSQIERQFEHEIGPKQLDKAINGVVFDDKDLEFMGDQKKNFDQRCVKIEDVSLSGFSLDFFRPLPNELTIRENLLWLHPGIQYNAIFLPIILQKNREVQHILNKAEKEKLALHEEKTFMEFIRDQSNTDQISDQFHRNLEKLVENNPKFSGYFLSSIFESKNIEYLKFYEKLGQLELNSQLIIVLKEIIDNTALPTQLLNYYLINCFIQCEKTSESSDKQTLQKQVRLLSAFMNYLIKMKKLNKDDLHFELAAFIQQFHFFPEIQFLQRALEGQI